MKRYVTVFLLVVLMISCKFIRKNEDASRHLESKEVENSLLKRVDYNFRDSLIIAIVKNDIESLETLLSIDKDISKIRVHRSAFNVFDQDMEINYDNIVQFALSNGSLESFKLLLENYDSDYFGDNEQLKLNVFLWDAAERGNVTACEYLLNKGAHLNFNEDIFGRSVLMSALVNNQRETVKYLLEKGADLEGDTALIGTPLTYSAMRNDLEMVKLFLDKGANVNYVVSYSENSALFEAVRKNNLKMTRLLLEHGADLSLTKKYYYKGDPSKPVIKYGLDNYVKYDKPLTIFELAKKNNNPEIIKLLEEYR